MGQDVGTSQQEAEQNPVRTHRGLPIYDGPHKVTRDICRDGPRPCPYTQCRQHLASDYSGNSPKQQQRRAIVLGSSNTCALDVANANPDGLTYKDVGLLLGMTGERVRQIEKLVLSRIDVDQRSDMLQVRRDKNRKAAAVRVRMMAYEYENVKRVAEQKGMTITAVLKLALGHFERTCL